MINDRIGDLLLKLENGFRDGTDLLLSGPWLIENEVTFHEILILSMKIADGLELMRVTAHFARSAKEKKPHA